MKKSNSILCILAGLLITASPLMAQPQKVSLERAEGERLSAAVGHYARARYLLLAAVREFDLGLAKANPQMLINVDEWRNSLLDRAEDLERVISPQPRASEEGVSYPSHPSLLNEAYR